MPEAGEGVSFSYLFSAFLINNQGQVAFEGFLDGIEPDDRLTRAIFFADEGQDAHVVVRIGDWLDVRGERRQISELMMDTGDDAMLGEDGSFAFYAAFTDGTQGLFLATVPEPSSVYVLLVAAVCTSFRHFRIAKRGRCISA